MESEYEHPIANSSSASSTTTTSSGGGSNNSSNSNLLMNLPMMPSLFDDHHERRRGNSGGGGGGGDEGDDEHEEEEEEEDEDDDEGVQLLRRHSLPEAPPMLMALEAVAAAHDEQPAAMFVAPAPLADNNNGGSSSASAATYAAVATQTTPPLVAPPSLLPSISSSSTSSSSTSSSSSTPMSLPHPPSPQQQQQEQQQFDQFDPLQQHSPAPPSFEPRNPSPSPPSPQPQQHPQPSQLAQQQQQQQMLSSSSPQPPLPPHSPTQHEQESHHQHSPSPSSIQQQTPPPPPPLLPPQPQEQSLHHPSPSPSQYDHHQVAAAADDEDDDLGLDDEDGRSSSVNPPPAIGQAVFATPPPPIGHHQQQSFVGDPTLIVGSQPSSSHPPLTAALPPPQGDDDDAAKESLYASHYSHYTHPSPEFAISHSHHNHNPCFGSGLESGCGPAGYDSTMYGNHMADGPYGGGSKGGGGHSHSQVDRIKQLYPNVDESETPLPRCWSPHDKCLTIGLSNNNLKVQYKGVGKQHNDAASVRTAHPIPPSCGLYYFEVKIICKGKNGYMGIGLTAQQFRMNHLPGWDKHSYGYHGDDGKSFSSSGTGQAYGPTFTTGDIIGCCVNFVTNTCFYTKNGIDLGVAFRDLPINTKLYPTVGLQTAGEEVDANFGQEPFKFDQFEDMLQQMRMETKAAIYNFPVPDDLGDPTIMLHKMVSSYLVHNGYSETADAFARATSQMLPEEMQSVRNRQKILKLIMSGRMGQAIEHTSRSYPGLLENNHSLMFMLKCRQFIEMINGSDLETSVIQSTKGYQNGKAPPSTTPAAAEATTNADVQTQTHTTTTTTATVITSDDQEHQQDLKKSKTIKDNEYDELPKNDGYIHDVEMENNGNGFGLNGNSCKNGNGNFSKSLDIDEEMDIDVSPSSSSKHVADIQRILQFGRELSQISQQLEKENNLNDEDKQMLHDAFSLIAYSNPWSSPLGWQLCPTKRENICAALNSAILESLNFPRRPPLDYCVAHAAELLKKMSQTSLGLCAFINVNDVFPPN